MNPLFVALPPDFNTRMKILHAVDAPIEQITVGSICEKAGISRQTFYKYFDSKFDISYWYVRFCDELTLEKAGRTQSWHDAFLGFFSLLKREQSFFTFSPHGHNPENLERANRHRSEMLRQSVLEHRHANVDDELDFYIRTYAELFNRCVGGWFRSEMEQSPETMSRLMENCVPGPLHKILDIETVESE